MLHSGSLELLLVIRMMMYVFTLIYLFIIQALQRRSVRELHGNKDKILHLALPIQARDSRTCDGVRKLLMGFK